MSTVDSGTLYRTHFSRLPEHKTRKSRSYTFLRVPSTTSERVVRLGTGDSEETHSPLHMFMHSHSNFVPTRPGTQTCVYHFPCKSLTVATRVRIPLLSRGLYRCTRRHKSNRISVPTVWVTIQSKGECRRRTMFIWCSSKTVWHNHPYCLSLSYLRRRGGRWRVPDSIRDETTIPQRKGSTGVLTTQVRPLAWKKRFLEDKHGSP